jgi:hypothetical protein
LAHISGSLLAETVCKCHWLPFIAITSENLGFYDGLSGFLVVGKNSVLRGSACTDRAGKNFLIFLAHTKFFPEFLRAAKKFLELFLKTRKTKKEFQRIIFSEIFLTRKKHFQDFFTGNKHDHFLTDDTCRWILPHIFCVFFVILITPQ